MLVACWMLFFLLGMDGVGHRREVLSLGLAMNGGALAYWLGFLMWLGGGMRGVTKKTR